MAKGLVKYVVFFELYLADHLLMLSVLLMLWYANWKQCFVPLHAVAHSSCVARGYAVMQRWCNQGGPTSSTSTFSQRPSWSQFVRLHCVVGIPCSRGVSGHVHSCAPDLYFIRACMCSRMHQRTCSSFMHRVHTRLARCLKVRVHALRIYAHAFLYPHCCFSICL